MSSTYVTLVKPHQWRLWENKPPLLGELDIELTERCNNACIHCYINLPANDPAVKRELSTDQVKQVLDEAASLGCLKVRFTGGEPLLRDDFRELYLHARKLGLVVVLFTNATRLTSELADLFARVPPRDKIEISLYGMKRESYEAISQAPGSFAPAWRGIHLLLERNVPFVVKSAWLPANRGEIEEFRRWAATITWMDQAPAYAINFDLRARRDDGGNRRIRKLRVSPADMVQFLSRDHNGYFKSMREFCGRFAGVTGDTLFACGAGARSGCVDAYGHLQPCMLVRHPATVYDLAGGSIRVALNEFFPQVRQMRATNPEYLRRCARCFLKGLCEQCPGKSWMEHGTLDTPVEYLCEIAHAQARYLGLLSQEEVAWEVADWRTRLQAFAARQGSAGEK